MAALARRDPRSAQRVIGDPTLVLDGPTRVHVGRWAELHEERTVVRAMARSRPSTTSLAYARLCSGRTGLRGTLGDRAIETPTLGDREMDMPTLDTSEEQRATIIPARTRAAVTRAAARRAAASTDGHGDPMVAWLGEGPAFYATLAFCALGLVALGVLVSLTFMLLVG